VTLRTGQSSEFPRKRNHAYCLLTRGGDLRVVVAPKMIRAPKHRRDAVLMHEIGHAILLSQGVLNHTEREADALAERVFGVRIGYDADDVQTLDGGVRPRPAYLDTPPLRRNGSRDALVKHLVCTCGMDERDAERIAPKKDVRSPRRALSPDQLRRFEGEVRRRVKDPALRTLLLLLPATGMRVGEACALSMAAFAETRRGRLKAGVVGKGDKPRTVLMGRRGSALVRDYIARSRGDWPSERVFVGPKGGKVSPRDVQAACREVGLALDAPDLTPHVLRHTYATIRVLECRDLESLRVQLGHGKLDGRRKTKRLPQVTMTYLDF
jgi:integrase